MEVMGIPQIQNEVLTVVKNVNSNASAYYYNFHNLQSSIASACNQQKKDQKSTLYTKLAISFNN
jgi:hypothetical protein